MTTYRDEVLADSPSHYWRFNDAQGAAALASELPSGWSLIPSGSLLYQQPGLLDGDSNKAIGLAGDSCSTAQTEAAPQTLTIECLIKTTQPGYVVGYGDSTNKDRNLYIDTSGRLQFGFWDGSSHVRAVGSTVVTDGVRHHVAARMGGGVISIMVDGALVGSRQYTNGPSVYNGQIIAGYANIQGWENWGGTGYSGTLDELAIYHAYLTDARILAHAQAVAGQRFQLGGKALLSSGSAATVVLIRDWSSYQHVSSVTPAADGTWGATVYAGTYEVTARGPSGFQPLTHGPITVG